MTIDNKTLELIEAYGAAYFMLSEIRVVSGSAEVAAIKAVEAAKAALIAHLTAPDVELEKLVDALLSTEGKVHLCQHRSNPNDHDNKEYKAACDARNEAKQRLLAYVRKSPDFTHVPGICVNSASMDEEVERAAEAIYNLSSHTHIGDANNLDTWKKYSWQQFKEKYIATTYYNQARAALTARARWRPMHEAPKNGMRIIGYAPRGITSHVGEMHWYSLEGRWAWDSCIVGTRPLAPAMWQYLPPAPAQAAGEE